MPCRVHYNRAGSNATIRTGTFPRAVASTSIGDFLWESFDATDAGVGERDKRFPLRIRSHCGAIGQIKRAGYDSSCPGATIGFTNATWTVKPEGEAETEEEEVELRQNRGEMGDRGPVQAPPARMKLSARPEDLRRRGSSLSSSADRLVGSPGKFRL